MSYYNRIARIVNIITGISYARNCPELLEFDIMKYRDDDFDFRNYKRYGTYRDLAKCERIMSNLHGGYSDEFKRLIWYSMVCRNEYICFLNRKKAYDDLRIKEIFDKYSES